MGRDKDPHGGAAAVHRQDQISGFDPVWYLQNNPDVRASGVDPLDHFLTSGLQEGRLGGPVQALALDHMLWRGFEAMAEPALVRLMAEGPPHERALAGWALARWYREAGQAEAARRAIDVFHATPDGARILRHPGPFLLSIDLALACGDPVQAENVLERARDRFGPLPDLDLAHLQIRRHRGADDWEIASCLTTLYARHLVLPVTLNEGDGSWFDRLDTASNAVATVAPADQPLVTVIVPVFNAARSLDCALRGLRAQSWQNLEILVVDDGSVDDGPARAAAAAKADPRIRVLRHDSNQGAYPARNTGFQAARGDFVTVHDSDDWAHPFKIEAQVLPLLADPSLRGTVSHWVRASDDLAMTRWRMEDRWIYRNVSSLMVRGCLREVLGYWDRVRVNADTEYYYRILHCFGPQSIREVHPGLPLAFGRTDPASLTNVSATHLRTQFKGVRRTYMEAAHDWHARADQPEDLYLPQHPETRPFRVPDALDLGDPAPPPSDFDRLRASPVFDRDWYLLGHGDVLQADISPVRHYLTGGAQNDLDPGPEFSSGGYRYAQGLAQDENPVLHFEARGRAAGAAPRPTFAGALAERRGDRPCTLIFSHVAGRMLFGAERSLLSVVRHIARSGGWPVVVLPALRNTDYLEALRAVSGAVVVVPQIWRHLQRPPVARTVEIIRDLIRSYAPETVLVNTIVMDAPLLAARAEGVPSVVYVRELVSEDVALCTNLGGSPQEIRQVLLQQADRFLATSQPVADWLDCPDRVTVRPNSVDDALFELPFDPGETLRVALISSNIAKKGLADLLAVARHVGAAQGRVRFLLIGPPTQDLHLMQPLPPNVDFRNYSADPVSAVAQADVVLSLSKFAESFGRTVLEAMAGGRPVICYDRGAPPSMIDSGVDGLVVPADDREAVTNAVLALAAARGRLRAMSAAARRKARVLQAQARAVRI